MFYNGHGDRLSAIDASFLQLESASAHMHVAWSAIMSAPASGAIPSIDAIRARVTARLAWVPRCRQRLLPAPLGLGEPRWVDDPQFDVAHHVVQIGDRDEAIDPGSLAALRDTLLSTPLDRARPLWQLAFIPHLSDGGRPTGVGAEIDAGEQMGRYCEHAASTPERKKWRWVRNPRATPPASRCGCASTRTSSTRPMHA
jgi:hypothetical protein